MKESEPTRDAAPGMPPGSAPTTPLLLIIADIAIPLALFVGALCLYSITLLPGNDAASDTMKYHFIGKILGLSHPPGSPLYIMANWLVSQVPFGEQAWRINFFSALCGAFAVVLLYRLTRYLSHSRLGGATAALLLAISQVFWRQSIIAEIYAPFMAVLLLSLYFLARWREKGHLRDYALACAFFGLAFGVHQMTAYFVPGFALFVFQDRGRILRTSSGLLATLGGALLGISTYLYYAIRPFFEPQFLEVRFTSIADYFNFITGGYFRTYMFAYTSAEMATERLSWLLRELLENLGPLALVLGVIGIALIALRRPRFGIMLSISASLCCLFAMGYKVGDSQIFLLPAIMTLCLGAGYCVGRLRFMHNLKPGLKWIPAAASLALIALLIADTRVHFVRSWVENDLRLHAGMETFASRMLARMDEDGVIVTGRQKSLFAVLYQEYVQGKRHHLIKHLHPGVWDGSMENLRAQLPGAARGGNYYFTDDLGPLIRSEWGALYHEVDVSRTLPEFLATVPEGKLLALAAPADGLRGIAEEDLKRLEQLGFAVTDPAASGDPYVALLVRRGGRFVGRQQSDQIRAQIALARHDTLAEGITAPIAIRAVARRNISRISADRHQERLAHGGLIIDVFDLFAKVQTDAYILPTDRIGTLGEYSFFAVSPLQPAWGTPLDSRRILNSFLAISGDSLRFGLPAAGTEPLSLSLLIYSRERPVVTVRTWNELVDGAPEGEAYQAELQFIPPRKLGRSGPRQDCWLLELTEARERTMYEIGIRGKYKRVDGILHRRPLFASDGEETVATAPRP
jgi:hypothetical protein